MTYAIASLYIASQIQEGVTFTLYRAIQSVTISIQIHSMAPMLRDRQSLPPLFLTIQNRNRNLTPSLTRPPFLPEGFTHAHAHIHRHPKTRKYQTLSFQLRRHP
eukprot:jgi/Psemu1/302463/fgenesh1_kg.70_\